MAEGTRNDMQVRFVHVNLVARDWRALAAFYEQVLGCEAVPPERDLEGPWLAAGTGVRGARLRGIHLRLPGHGPDGPTLEIFAYDPLAEGPAPAVNRPGLGHLAFAVEDVARARQAVIDAGGGIVGEVVTLPVAGAGSVTFAYVTDPEGNILELQHWLYDG
jgi:catechol 2,3-dioxygenase-like lactoylglutathione lyase family enzyme